MRNKLTPLVVPLEDVGEKIKYMNLRINVLQMGDDKTGGGVDCGA